MRVKKMDRGKQMALKTPFDHDTDGQGDQSSAMRLTWSKCLRLCEQVGVLISI